MTNTARTNRCIKHNLKRAQDRRPYKSWGNDEAKFLATCNDKIVRGGQQNLLQIKDGNVCGTAQIFRVAAKRMGSNWRVVR
jgi:hypothetical protein